MFKLASLLVLLFFRALTSALPSNISTPASPPREIPGANRRGIAYNNVRFVGYFDNWGGHTTWCYNWDSQTADTPFEFVPMLHSIHPYHVERWNYGAMRAINGNRNAPTHLLGFNEPDNCDPYGGGSCMSVRDAVNAWRAHIQPLKSQKELMYLGSPAVSNSAATDTTGLGWLAKFIEECSGCSIDFINIHWYDSKPGNVEYFKNHINAARAVANGRPIWITEFKPAGNDQQIMAFLDEVLPWLDSSGDIHRYAYFMAAPSAGMLINQAQSGLSDVGHHYLYK